MEQVLVEFALQQILDLVSEGGKVVCGVGREVKELEKELQEMKYLLEDADRGRQESKTIVNWIARIRGLAYRAEAAIEIHAARVSSRRRQAGLKKHLRRYSCILKECYSLHQLATEVSEIKSELATIMQDNGMKRSIIDVDRPKESSTDWTRKTFPTSEIDHCFVGKQDDLKTLISLVADHNEHRLISVWGMGGVGKTTIVKRAYNHIIETKKGFFESFAWVCITQNCRIRSVLKDVLTQLIPTEKSSTKQDLSKLSVEEMIRKLCKIQTSKRCLIVLDDLWNYSDWECLKHAFNVQDLQSKILVTTRYKNVAEIGFPLELGLLNMDEACELLEKKAFPRGKNPEFALEEKLVNTIGKELVGKCGNLALAICLLGGVLRKKKTLKDWETVNKNFKAVLYRGHDERGSKIDVVVNLSYEYLPYYLKPCFLYLGIFKEDESINVEDVYRMWIAQGMISNRGNDGSLMDIAELYLSELASTSIVQVEIEDVIPTRKFATCKLHDVVRELCLKIGEKEDFGVAILEYKDGKLRSIPRVARHLAIHFRNKYEPTETRARGEDHPGKDLRSLRIIHEREDINFHVIDFPPQSIVDFKKCRYLRELVIESFKFEGRKLPKGITNLVLLRCLRIQYCELDELPLSLRKLVYLETLDLDGSSILRVPKNVFKKLFRLKHLVLSTYYYDAITRYSRLRLEGVDELESMIGFDSSVHEINCTSRMKNLRQFHADIYDDKSLLDIIDAITKYWNKLEHCRLDVKGDCQLTSEDDLTRLFTCPNLSYLNIFVELGKLPLSSAFISSKLVQLSLFSSKMEGDPMGILGMFPCLKELMLCSEAFVGEQMRCPASSFGCLKRLVLNDLPKLREWKVEQGAMHLLSEIMLQDCPNLKVLPDGLSCVSTLKKVTVINMPELAKRVSAKGEDFHKIHHVPSVNIIDEY